MELVRFSRRQLLSKRECIQRSVVLPLVDRLADTDRTELRILGRRHLREALRLLVRLSALMLMLLCIENILISKVRVFQFRCVQISDSQFHQIIQN